MSTLTWHWVPLTQRRTPRRHRGDSVSYAPYLTIPPSSIFFSNFTSWSDWMSKRLCQNLETGLSSGLCLYKCYAYKRLARKPTEEKAFMHLSKVHVKRENLSVKSSYINTESEYWRLENTDKALQSKHWSNQWILHVSRLPALAGRALFRQVPCNVGLPQAPLPRRCG